MLKVYWVFEPPDCSAYDFILAGVSAGTAVHGWGVYMAGLPCPPHSVI